MTQSEIVLSMVLAACGGALTCASVNVGPCVMHFAARSGKTLSRCAMHATNAGYLALVSIGGGICIVSTYFGPVAITMPTNASSALLVNMLIQGGLGIKHYTRSMKVGTFVLAAAAVSLGEVGPLDLEDIRDMSATDIIQERPFGCAWLAMVSAAVMACAIAAQCRGSHPMLKLLLIAFVDANSTAAAWSLQKMLVISPLSPTFVVLAVAWLIVAFFSIFAGAQALWHCDLALYYPVAQCMQFLSNAVLGFVVWGDAERMRAPVSYAMVLFLSCAGAYLTCSCDPSTARAAETPAKACTVSQGVAVEEARKDDVVTIGTPVPTPTSCAQVRPLGTLMFMQSMTDVESTWSLKEELEKPECIGQRLEAALQQGIQAGCVDAASLLHLCGVLGGALACREACRDVECGSALLEQWHADRMTPTSCVSERSSSSREGSGAVQVDCFTV